MGRLGCIDWGTIYDYITGSADCAVVHAIGSQFFLTSLIEPQHFQENANLDDFAGWARCPSYVEEMA